MRLITHNLLMCNTKKCPGGYPLRITLAEEEGACKREPQDLDPQFIRKMLQRMDYPVLVETAKSVGLDLPATYGDSDLDDDMFISQVHGCILEFHVLEGTLTCSDCNTVYKIKKGIPDMLNKEEAE